LPGLRGELRRLELIIVRSPVLAGCGPAYLSPVPIPTSTNMDQPVPDGTRPSSGTSNASSLRMPDAVTATTACVNRSKSGSAPQDGWRRLRPRAPVTLRRAVSAAGMLAAGKAVRKAQSVHIDQHSDQTARPPLLARGDSSIGPSTSRETHSNHGCGAASAPVASPSVEVGQKRKHPDEVHNAPAQGRPKSNGRNTGASVALHPRSPTHMRSANGGIDFIMDWMNDQPPTHSSGALENSPPVGTDDKVAVPTNRGNDDTTQPPDSSFHSPHHAPRLPYRFSGLRMTTNEPRMIKGEPRWPTKRGGLGAMRC